MRDFASRLETLHRYHEVDSPFGSIATHELGWFRREEWLQDASFKRIMGYLMLVAENAHNMLIGAVNPMYPHFSELAAQKEVVASSGAFLSENKLELMPMWSVSHWCASVFDFRDNTCHMFDPMQKKENYEDMQSKIIELLPMKARQLSFRRIKSPKQEDISNCGLFC
ncbi:hypothetical protein P3T76_013361 [Phytophthora citrophthora]|uniref:Ubiquitin-like protease family profile domain-containing protein n=1 Tax=Phytophthora citrophthora TaxID=4793 RepID=A0AAD9G386_9STRA|nr:hypothetical protein P3T76_013361 [Phytophthora citrophthora]